jgi:hypothetical protein
MISRRGRTDITSRAGLDTNPTTAMLGAPGGGSRPGVDFCLLGIYWRRNIFGYPHLQNAVVLARAVCTLALTRSVRVGADTLLGEEFNLLTNVAGLMAPLALVSIVTGLHPFFVLMYGILFGALFSRRLVGHASPVITFSRSSSLVAIGVMCARIVITFTE